MIAYLTDVEGRWDKLASFAADNPYVWLEGAALRLADGVTFVFGGDVVDRGPHGRRIIDLLLAARRDYGDRVVLLAGNRDLNKLRLRRELAGAPPRGAPTGATGGELLRWILANTMGAAKAFDHRAAELGRSPENPDTDAAVVQSYLDDLAPGGALRAYLGECRLGFRAGATVFLHGGVTAENFGVVPGAPRAPDVDGWLAALDQFYRDELATFAAGRPPTALIAYQTPHPGTQLNQDSVVYARPTDELGNPRLPDAPVIARLRASGIGRVVVGHTPSGDCPAILRDGDFELVLGDNSYSRIERGSQLAFTDDETHVRALTELDDGTRAIVHYTTSRTNLASPLGHRDRETGQLVKACLDDGRYLLFRGFANYRVEQLAAHADDLAGRTLIVPRARSYARKRV